MQADDDMKAEYRDRIKRLYDRSRGDSTELFEAILRIAGETGLDSPLAFLEQCVIKRRLAWWESAGMALPRAASPLMSGFRLFYEGYLGLAIPRDGEVVEATEHRLVSRWWNRCPTLEACQKLGLDTRVICKRVYHHPVEALLQRIDPRLRFERNYAAIRPYAPYCEEILCIAKQA